jgi:hypothetical protein
VITTPTRGKACNANDVTVAEKACKYCGVDHHLKQRPRNLNPIKSATMKLLKEANVFTFCPPPKDVPKDLEGSSMRRWLTSFLPNLIRFRAMSISSAALFATPSHERSSGCPAQSPMTRSRPSVMGVAVLQVGSEADKSKSLTAHRPSQRSSRKLKIEPSPTISSRVNMRL